MLNWIQDFLKERTIQARVGGVMSKTVETENSTPQGSIISPVLFNIMINDIFANIGGDLDRFCLQTTGHSVKGDEMWGIS